MMKVLALWKVRLKSCKKQAKLFFELQFNESLKSYQQWPLLCMHTDTQTRRHTNTSTLSHAWARRRWSYPSLPQVSTGLRGLFGAFEFGSKHTTVHVLLWCDAYVVLERCLESNIMTLVGLFFPSPFSFYITYSVSVECKLVLTVVSWCWETSPGLLTVFLHLRCHFAVAIVAIRFLKVKAHV